MSTSSDFQEAVASAQKKDVILRNGYVDKDGELHTEVYLREMLHPEEKIIGSNKPDIEKVLRSCLMRVGTYTDPEEIKETIYPQLVKGDGDHLLIELRRLSLINGDTYTFTVGCPATDCKRDDTHDYDLSTIGFVDEPAEDEQAKRIFTFDINDRKCRFRHLLMQDSKMIAEIEKTGQDRLTKSLGLRLIDVDGETPRDFNPKAKTELAVMQAGVKMINRYIPAYRNREQIRLEMKRCQARPDTMLETTCEYCGRVFRHRMPIDPTFLRPSLEE